MKEFLAPKEHPEFDITRWEWLTLHLKSLLNKKFFGKVTVHIENGVIVRLTKEENLKP